MKATEKIPAGQAPAEELPSCSHIIRRRRNAAEIKSGYIRLDADIAALAVIGILLFTQVFLVMQAPGNGMFPAIKDGDLIIGFRMQGEYVKDDVVVYEADGKTHVGRIMGRETDVITMDDTGTLFVNGTVQGGEILFPTYPEDGIEYPYTVPEGCVFILGDYRTQATDSREYGSISLENVKAKVITILRRRQL